MSVENTSPNSSKYSLIGIFLFVGIFLGGFVYFLELTPAKSWNVKILAECTTSINDKKVASEILDQVSENPLAGKVDRLIRKCRSVREDEKLVEAKALMAYAKESVKTN
jgi:hypothetical protein